MAVDGNWNITMSTPMGERNATLSLKNSGGTLTGSQGADGNSGRDFRRHRQRRRRRLESLHHQPDAADPGPSPARWPAIPSPAKWASARWAAIRSREPGRKGCSVTGVPAKAGTHTAARSTLWTASWADGAGTMPIGLKV